MDVVYFKCKQQNWFTGLIYILHVEVKNNKMLFNSRDWIIMAPLISVYPVRYQKNNNNPIPLFK